MKRILVIDDQPEVCEIINDFLNISGYKTLVAHNGQDALEQFQRHKPDAAIVDVEMPVMNGIQFSRQILTEKPDFPIIIITGFLGKYSETEFKKMGISSILQKPIDLAELKQHLENIFKA